MRPVGASGPRNLVVANAAQALRAVFEEIAENYEKHAREQCHGKVLEYAPEKPDQEHDHLSDTHILISHRGPGEVPGFGTEQR